MRTEKSNIMIKNSALICVCTYLTGSADFARVQNRHEARSCGSQEPGSDLRCHGYKRDWQLFLGSLRRVGRLL